MDTFEDIVQTTTETIEEDIPKIGMTFSNFEEMEKFIKRYVDSKDNLVFYKRYIKWQNALMCESPLLVKRFVVNKKV